MRTAHTHTKKKALKKRLKREKWYLCKLFLLKYYPQEIQNNKEQADVTDKHPRLYLAQPLTPASPWGLSPINPRAHGKLASAVFFPRWISHLAPRISQGQEPPDITPQTRGAARLKAALFSHLEPQVWGTLMPFGSTEQHGKEIFHWRCESWEGTCCAQL